MSSSIDLERLARAAWLDGYRQQIADQKGGRVLDPEDAWEQSETARDLRHYGIIP